MKQQLLKSDYIILRKIPFQESSLIVSGLSPAFGRLDFLLKGARSHQSRKFPYAGLFRVLHVEFQNKSSDSTLFHIRNHTALCDFDAIARNLEHYLALCGYASFLLKHTRSMLELPLTYQALLCALSRLCADKGTRFDLECAKLVFLYESGYVPEETENNSGSSAVLHDLLDYALDKTHPVPDLREEYKLKLMHWIGELCRYAQEN